MNALHLPGAAEGEPPPYSFPDKPPSPAMLQYTSTSYPIPEPPSSSAETTYLLAVQFTALTRGELAWAEILDVTRFSPHGSSVPGHDVVGTITTIYPSSSSSTTTAPKFNEGDLVWGLIDFDRDGAAASYALVKESEIALLPPCPPSTPPAKWQEMLATLPLSGLTAYQALHTHAAGALPPNNEADDGRGSVLVTGASGSVGILTIQLAHSLGHHVTALVSTHKASSLLKHVDVVLRYDSPAFTSLPSYMQQHSIPPADIIIDCVGGATLASILDEQPGVALRKGGKVITIVEEKEGATFFIVKPNGPELEELGKLVTEGKLVGYVDGVYALAAGREAMEKVESKRGAMGKVVLKVAESGSE